MTSYVLESIPTSSWDEYELEYDLANSPRERVDSMNQNHGLSTCGKYIIDYDNVLGRGTFGTVYCCSISSKYSLLSNTYNMQSKSLYAIKIFKSSISLETYSKEIQILQYLAKFEFQYIAYCYEFLKIRNRDAIIMERLQGGEVFERILIENKFSEHRAAKCLQCLIKGLIELHRIANVLHRDIKPENLVFITNHPESNIKLIDFGSSVYIENENDLNDGIILGKVPTGTSLYMAPEVLKKCEYSSKSDIWSAGVTLYSLLSGSAPFDQENRYRQKQQILKGDYYSLDSKQWNHVSEDAKDLISKMLTVNLSKRIILEDILTHPWLIKALEMPEVIFNNNYLENARKFNAKSNFRRLMNATVYTIRLRKAVLESYSNTLSNIIRTDSVETNFTDIKSIPELDSVISNFTTTSIDVEPSSIAEPSLSLTEVREKFIFYGQQYYSIKGYPIPSSKRDICINFEFYCQLMNEIGFHMLAQQKVYDIFDTDADDRISYQEFLTTILLLQQVNEDDYDIDEITMRSFFEVFDLDGSGEITIEELKIVIANLLHKDIEIENSLHINLYQPYQESTGYGNGNGSGNGNGNGSSNNSPLGIHMSDTTRDSFSNGRESFLCRESLHARDSFLGRESIFGRESSHHICEDENCDNKYSVNSLFIEMDSNHDGKITLDEFLLWMNKDLKKLKSYLSHMIDHHYHDC